MTAADAGIVCGMNAGTASEVALALRALRPTVLIAPDERAAAFFATLGGPLRVAATPEDAVAWVERTLAI